MNPSPQPPIVSELVQHVEFMRALAGRLVRDEHAAEDLVQEAQIALLTRPPGSAVTLRAWLAGVLKHLSTDLYRRQSRREYHESQAASDEHELSAEDVAARLEGQRILSALVEELPGAYRTVIYLRFHEGFPPREIAKRLDLPVSTVKTRQSRGLEMLRTQLDKAHAGQRASWCALLVPLTRGFRPNALTGAQLETGTFVGGILMQVKSAVILVALLSGLGWMLLKSKKARTVEPSAETLSVLAAVPEVASESSGDSTSSGRPIPDVQERVEIEDAPAAHDSRPGWTVRGRVSSSSGEGLAGASVELGFANSRTLQIETDQVGDYSARVLLPEDLSPHGRFFLSARASHPGHGQKRLGRTLEPERGTNTTRAEVVLDITLERTAILRGSLLYATGQPASRMRVQLRTSEDTVQHEAQSDASGYFELPVGGPGQYQLVAGSWAHGITRAGPFRVLPATDRDVGQITLPGRLVLHGRMRLPDDTPLALVDFSLGRVALDEGNEPLLPTGFDEYPRSGQTDREGRFEVRGLQPGLFELELTWLMLPKTRQKFGPFHSSEFADVLVDLQFLRVRVVDAAGLGIPGAQVTASNQSGLSSFGRTGTGAGGRVLGVEPGLWNVTAVVPGAAPMSRAIEILKGSYETELTLELDFSPATGKLVLDVRDQAGAPVSGWSVSLIRPGDHMAALGALHPDGEGFLGPIPIGKYDIWLALAEDIGFLAPQSRPSTRVFENQTSIVPITLPHGGWLDLRLSSTEATDLTPAEVVIFADALDGRAPRRLRFLNVSPDARFPPRFKPRVGDSGKTDILAEGRWELSLSAKGFLPVVHPITIRGGEVTLLEVAFERE